MTTVVDKGHSAQWSTWKIKGDGTVYINFGPRNWWFLAPSSFMKLF